MDTSPGIDTILVEMDFVVAEILPLLGLDSIDRERLTLHVPTKKILEDLSKRCELCQKICLDFTSFGVSLGAENIRFNERVLMVIISIGHWPVPHMVDDETHCSSVTSAPKQSGQIFSAAGPLSTLDFPIASSSTKGVLWVRTRSSLPSMLLRI